MNKDPELNYYALKLAISLKGDDGDTFTKVYDEICKSASLTDEQVWSWTACLKDNETRNKSYVDSQFLFFKTHFFHIPTLLFTSLGQGLSNGTKITPKFHR